MSKYINCGNTQGGQSADSYEVQLSVQTVLQAADAGTTRVLSTVTAQARPMTFSGEYSGCSSIGNLERAIAAIVAARLNP